jgi:two-component system, OmpR family, response regulator
VLTFVGQTAVVDTLLVVEDDSALRALLGDGLRRSGFDVMAIDRGTDAVDLALRHRPDLIVLDVMLPDIDGFEVVKRLREDGQRVPVVFLTAREATGDKIRGLTIGGDDYVTKPFSLVEMVARVRAVLTRARVGAAAREELRFADVDMDVDAHVVRRRGHVVDLPATEFRLLRFILLNPNRVLSRTQILANVWGYDFRGNPRIVDVYLSALRRKLESHGPRLIHTLRGLGYILRRPIHDVASDG